VTRNYGGVTEADSLYKAGKHTAELPPDTAWQWLNRQVGKVGKKIKPFIDRNYK
jgi:hypothetical protein